MKENRDKTHISGKYSTSTQDLSLGGSFQAGMCEMNAFNRQAFIEGHILYQCLHSV